MIQPLEINTVKKFFRPAFFIEMEYSNTNTIIIVIVELRPLYAEADVFSANASNI